MVAPAAREDSGQRRPQEEADIPRVICQQSTKRETNNIKVPHKTYLLTDSQALIKEQIRH
jgi:hypothetical protein